MSFNGETHKTWQWKSELSKKMNGLLYTFYLNNFKILYQNENKIICICIIIFVLYMY